MTVLTPALLQENPIRMISDQLFLAPVLQRHLDCAFSFHDVAQKLPSRLNLEH